MKVNNHMALLHLCYCQWRSCCLVLIEVYNKCRGEEWLITFTIQWNDHRLSGDHFTWWHHHHSTPKPPEKVTFTRFLPHSHSLTALIYNTCLLLFFVLMCISILSLCTGSRTFSKDNTWVLYWEGYRQEWLLPSTDSGVKVPQPPVSHTQLTLACFTSCYHTLIHMFTQDFRCSQ